MNIKSAAAALLLAATSAFAGISWISRPAAPDGGGGPSAPPLGSNSEDWTLTGGPDEVTSSSSGSHAWHWSFTIAPPLGSGVTANSAKAKILCDGQWKDVDSSCITVATAGGAIAQVTIKNDGGCPCSGCSNCTKVNVEWQDTSTNPPKKVGVYTMPWPNQRKHPRVSFEQAALPPGTTIVGITITDDVGVPMVGFTGDVNLAVHAIGRSVVAFENGSSEITIPVWHGSGAARLDLSGAFVADTVWIEATAPAMDAHRARVMIQ